MGPLDCFPDDYNCIQVCVYQDLREISNSLVAILLNQEHLQQTGADLGCG